MLSLRHVLRLLRDRRRARERQTDKLILERLEPRILLNGAPIGLDLPDRDDTVRVKTVHAGTHNIPEKLVVITRTNTYYGPRVDLVAEDDIDKPSSDSEEYSLTCPGPDSHPLLWRVVTDSDGFIQKRTKLAEVSVEVFNVAGYDFCERCEEPIKDPMHRSLALLGQCPGGMNDD